MPYIKKEGDVIVEIFARPQVGQNDLVFVADDDAELVAHRESSAEQEEIERKIQAEIASRVRADAIASLKGRGEIPQDYANTPIPR